MSDYFKRLERIMRAKLNEKLGVFGEDDELDIDPDDILRAGGFDPKEFPDAAGHTAGAQDEVTKAYANLELARPATLADAKKAWRKLMAKFHPDRHQGDPRKEEIANKIAAQLTDAYRVVRRDLGEDV